MTFSQHSKPIFVRGLSRSGGTLMCTLLDAHPDVSFSFELYPNLLDVEAGFDVKRLIKELRRCKTLKKAADCCPTHRFRTFLNRMPRGGLDHSDFADILESSLEQGYDLASINGQMYVVQECARLKMIRNKTSRWGLKCNGRLTDYLDAWPDLKFIDVLRDGRDVFASQKNTGSFNPNPTTLATAWVNTHQKFMDLKQKLNDQVLIVRYEDLTADPTTKAREICEYLEIPFTEELLAFHEKELTVFSANHLSHSRITSAIDTKKVARWKNELTEAEVNEFMSVAGDLMSSWGYH